VDKDVKKGYKKIMAKFKEKMMMEQHKGLVMFIGYIAISIIICIVVFCLKNQILNLSLVRIFYRTIDEATILGIVTAINICISTGLTLSLTIEGNRNSMKFGLSPKELNEYLGLPISLWSAFVGLVVFFVCSLAAIGLNEILLFYLISILSLFYFLISIIRGLSVLRGNNNKTYRQLRKKLSNISKINFENSESGLILMYLFSKGTYVGDLFSNIRGNSNKTLDAKDANILASLLIYLSYYLKSSHTSNEQITIHWSYFKEHLYNLFKKKSVSIYYSCKDEFFKCIYFIYLRNDMKNVVADELYQFFIHYQSFITNSENKELINNIFLKLVNYSLQNGDLTLFYRLKRNICQYEFGKPFDKEGRFNFCLISFLLYSYFLDSKVPIDLKTNIKKLVTNFEDDPRLNIYSWGTILLKIVENEFDLERDKFVDIINKTKEWFEFTVYGKVFTPAIKEDSAYEWYWTLLLESQKECNASDYFNLEDEFECYLFDKFYNNVTSGKISAYRQIIDFYKGKETNNYYFRFEPNIKEKIDEALQLSKKITFEKEISDNAREHENIVNTCKEAIKQELSKYEIGDEEDNSHTCSISFTQIYDQYFDLDLNVKTICYNVSNDFAAYVNDYMKIIKLNSNDDYAEEIKKFFKNTKSRFINKKFYDYCLFNVLNPKCKDYLDKSSVFNNELFYYPTCFAENMPALKNIEVDIKVEEITDLEMSDVKDEYDSGNGYYLLKDVRYNESEFELAFKKCFIKLKIGIAFTLIPSPKGGITINPFEP